MFVRKLDRLKNLKQLARLEHLDNIPDCLNALVLLATNEIITEEEFTQILDRLEKNLQNKVERLHRGYHIPL